MIVNELNFIGLRIDQFHEKLERENYALSREFNDLIGMLAEHFPELQEKAR